MQWNLINVVGIKVISHYVVRELTITNSKIKLYTDS